MLLNYCSDIANNYKIKIGNNNNKLAPNLGNQTKCILHYKNLQLHLSLGIKLVGIHRVLGCKQSDLLKEYIDFDTDKKKCWK